jgi:hypothetical protein
VVLGKENDSVKLTILEQLRRGISLARTGDRVGAEVMFDAVLLRRPDHEEALVWKAAVVSDPAVAVHCLEHALRLNPDNQRARAGLEWAYKRLQGFESHADVAETVASPAPKMPPPPPAPVFQPEDSFEPPLASDFQPDAHATASNHHKAPGAEPAPYKKRRLSDAKTGGMPAVTLPPEALPWARTSESHPKKKKSGRINVTKDSAVFKAASPQIAFRLTPQVMGSGDDFSRPVVPLRWILLLFGLALGLALLSFVLDGLVIVLGSLALVAAIIGVILFGRAHY